MLNAYRISNGPKVQHAIAIIYYLQLYLPNNIEYEFLPFIKLHAIAY